MEKFKKNEKNEILKSGAPQILTPKNFKKNGKKIAFVDCGAKHGIFRDFLRRGVQIWRFRFDENPLEIGEKFDGIFFSNGPGDPEKIPETIEIARRAIAAKIPIFGICLGNQILALASGGRTRKMKFGHRGANQPVQNIFTKKCFVTAQNHGFEIDEKSLPPDFEIFLKNLNDNSVEGIRHKNLPIFSVQFHPEACAGPRDAEIFFEEFLQNL